MLVTTSDIHYLPLDTDDAHRSIVRLLKLLASAELPLYVTSERVKLIIPRDDSTMLITEIELSHGRHVML